MPERGRIGIFNRSYYEEVLVVRVHQEILKSQKLPPPLVGERIWNERLDDIAHFEDYLTRQGIVVLKFFLNVSREERRSASWSASTGRTSTGSSRLPTCTSANSGPTICTPSMSDPGHGNERAPWFVVPADNKWFTRLVVAAAIVEAVEALDLAYPKVDAQKVKELAAARAELAAEKSGARPRRRE